MSAVQPASDLPVPPPIVPERMLNSAQWGMASFLLSEVAFFCTLIATYVAFMGKDTVGPTPAQALSLPLVILTTICLLSSSVVIHFAERSLKRGQQRTFSLLLAGTAVLGIVFLIGTAVEWRGLIIGHHLTIGRNLFGTTYYTLVGFHGLHVTVGVVAMLIFLGISMRQQLTEKLRTGVELVGWYWHFVDAVWIVVFLVVYVASRGGAT
jgi:cytochrome c oxidase subunit 3/cytochrome o ubiquinol oxidase subunit 3